MRRFWRCVDIWRAWGVPLIPVALCKDKANDGYGCWQEVRLNYGGGTSEILRCGWPNVDAGAKHGLCVQHRRPLSRLQAWYGFLRYRNS